MAEPWEMDWSGGSATPAAQGKEPWEMDWSKPAAPQKPESLTGAVGRGLRESFQQVPQLAYGLGAGAAAAAETAFGEGGVATSLKQKALEGYTRWQDKIQAGARENDSIDTAWDKAQNGDPGALADWLAHGIGYAGGQVLQALASAGIGYAAGRVTAQTAAKQIAGGMVEKEINRIAESAAGKAAIKELGEQAAEQAFAKEATAAVAGRLGQATGLAANAFGQEGGEIFGELTSANRERALTGEELGRAFASTLAAGGLEFLTDKLGFDAAFGKLPMGKAIDKMDGMLGRVARGAATAALAAPVEGATEYAQTLIENYGSGKEQSILPSQVSEATLKEARESAALGALGGTVVGGAAALRGPQKDDSPRPKLLEAESTDQAIEQFKFDLTANRPSPVNLDELARTYKDATPEEMVQAQERLLRAIEWDPNYAKNEAGEHTLNGAPLKVLAPQELPAEKRDAYEAISALAKAQGLQAVVYQDDERLPSGFANSARESGTLFVSSNTLATDPLVIAAHEIQHLAKQSDAQANYIKVVEEELTERAREVGLKRHGEMSDEKLLAEIRADLEGDSWADPVFHGIVIDKMREQLGDKAAEKNSVSLLESIAQLIKRLRAVLTGTTFTTEDGKRLANQYVNNLERVQDALASAVADRFVKEGYRPPGAETNTSQLLVNRTLDLLARKTEAADIPWTQRTLKQHKDLKEDWPAIPKNASESLRRAMLAARVERAFRPPEDRLNLEAVRAGVQMAPRAIVQDFSDTLFYPQTAEAKRQGQANRLKNPVTLKDGTRLSGFTDPLNQTTFHGYDKNGERITIARQYVNPEDIVSSRDGDKTANKVREGLLALRASTQPADVSEKGQKVDKWQTIDGGAGGLTKEAAERWIRFQQEGNSVIKPPRVWEGYDLRAVEDETNPGMFLVQARKKGGIQAAPRAPQTPEFKKWFEGSTVVDEKGEPLVVYHGTRSGKIEVFEGERRVAGHFAFSPDVAEQYANSQGEQPNQQVVYPVFLSAKRIFDARKPEHRKIAGVPYREGDSFGFPELERYLPRIKRAGFDSYYDFEYVPALTPEAQPDGVAVFNPNQIKSVFNDRPTESANISAAPRSDVGHRRELTSGRYVGAPDWVGNSPQKLAALRQKLAQMAKEGEVGRFWYEKSARSVLDFMGGNKEDAEKFIGLLALFSASNALSSNTTMALKAWYQYKAGVPINAGRFPSTQSRKAQAWLERGEDYGGIKVNNFYQDLMEEIDPSKVDHTHATMDMWLAIAFDYGAKTLDQGPKYLFAQREVTALAEKLGWRPHQVQAAIWTAIRARTLESETKWKAREVALRIRERKADGTPGDVIKGREYDHFRTVHRLAMAHPLTQAEVDANNADYATELAARTVQISWEAEPGRGTGILPGLRSAPLAQKQEYLQAVIRALTGPDGEDLVAQLVGLAPGRSIQGLSAWEGVIGAGVQTMIPTNTEGVGQTKAVAPIPRAMLNLYAAVKGYVLNQDAVVWHLPVYDDANVRKNGLDLVTKRALTEEEMRTLYSAITAEFGTQEIAPGYTERGARMLNFVEGLDNVRFQKGMDQIILALPDDFGGGLVGYHGFRSDGEYISNNWQENPNGESYQERLRTGRPDLQERATDLRARVEAVNREFSEKYAWGPAVSGGTSGAGVNGRDGGSEIQAAPRQGRLDLVGVHYSTQERRVLSGAYFGTGMQGAEARRVAAATDPRLKSRVYAYVNSGSGVFPEKYVGGVPHVLALDGLYDLDADPLSLNNGDQNAFESAVLDAGYSGYAVRFPRQAVGILLGDSARAVAAQPRPMGYRGEDLPPVPAPQLSEDRALATAVAEDRTLPAGERSGAEWREILAKSHPTFPVARIPEGTFYRDQVAKLALNNRPLSEITVDITAVEAGTGKRIVMREKADVALREVDDQLSKARSLLECLAL